MRKIDDHNDGDEPLPPRSSSTLTVLGLMVTAALTFSYLGAYKVSDALVSADFLSPWPPTADPRPKWLLIGFLVLIFACAGIGALLRIISCRSLRDIDRIANDD